MAKSSLYDLVTIEEYLELEEKAPERHELFRGRIYAMAGASENHIEITAALGEHARRALRGKPCRYLNQDAKTVVSDKGSGYYADGAIACPPHFIDPKRGTYDNPTVIFEVLSPSTADFDRTDKFDDYKRLDSLQEYVLLESRAARVEVFRRQADGKWGQSVYLAGTQVHLDSVGVFLNMDDLYEGIAFAPSTPLPDDAA